MVQGPGYLFGCQLYSVAIISAPVCLLVRAGTSLCFCQPSPTPQKKYCDGGWS